MPRLIPLDPPATKATLPTMEPDLDTMLVAWLTTHLRNGFFIFRPGEGYEYVMTLTLGAVALSGLGGGRWSIDSAVGWFQPPGWTGLALGVVLGAGGAAALLAAF